MYVQLYPEFKNKCKLSMYPQYDFIKKYNMYFMPNRSKPLIDANTNPIFLPPY